jgi:outer membrane immunogenic protein
MALASETGAMLRIDCEAVMWKITTRGFTLEEVAIMAAMNLLAGADTAKYEKRASQTSSRRNQKETKMELKYSIQRPAVIVGILAFVSITALAQETRSEISVQGAGFFTKDTDGNGIPQNATNTGGFLIGYRYNINRWLAAEANYGYDRNTQVYFGSTPARVQSDVHQITGAAVVKLPGFARIQPYALAGGGALVFNPSGNSGGSFAGASEQTRGAFFYGVGADYVLAKHWSIRAEYRGLVYKAPSFNLAGLDTDSWTHTAQPSAGIVFRF